MDFNYSLFDSLIVQNRSFSVYRLPESCSLVFILQQKSKLRSLTHLTELNGKKGFVMAPFVVSKQKPIVLIPPDIMLHGEKAIFDFLAKESEKHFVREQTPSFVRISDAEIQSKYQKAFELFESALHSNICEKIVLSRKYAAKRLEGFSPGKTFKSACIKYPDAFVYLCHTPLTGTWCGSSPELMLSANGGNGQTVALAGTKRIIGKTRAFDWDEKNCKEQQIVSDYIEKLLEAQNMTYHKEGPYAAKAGNLMHLKTVFDFRINDADRLGDLLESLHPTPAVCGFPKEKAYQLITENEGYDRSYYSGFSGPLSIESGSYLFVNLRCMEIDPEELTFYAGGGLLPSSKLKTEWKETKEKLKTMLSLVAS